MNKLQITNETKYNFKHKYLFKKIIKHLGIEFKTNAPIEVSVIIIDNNEITKLNKKFRNKNYATDILSFPQGALELRKQINFYLMGDIYISWEQIEKQAQKFGHSTKREWAYLFTHGMLHLFGLNHTKEEEEKHMNLIVDSIMYKIKVSR